jgi:hypothetical protein
MISQKITTMKNLIVILAGLMLPLFLSAQDTPLSALYKNFAGEPGFSTTEILPGSTSFEWEKEMDAGRIKELMKSIESIRIVNCNGDEANSKQEKAWKKMEKAASDERYVNIMNVKSDDDEVYLYRMAGESGKTRELALLVKYDNGVMLLTMTGDMDMSAIFSKDNMEAFLEMGKCFKDKKAECPHHD